jgi:hypothetical protein
MRCFVLLSIFGLAMGGPTLPETGQCLVDSGEAVSDIMDASLFIWAAAKRCGMATMELKCSIDVMSAIKSVNSMVNVALKVLSKCDVIHGANKGCAMQASRLSEYTAGLGTSTAMVVQKCATTSTVVPSTGQGAVMCTLSMKNTAKHLFAAISGIQKATPTCSTGDQSACAANALDIVGSLAAMGEYLAETVGQCQRATGAQASRTKNELCAGAVQGLVHNAAKMGKAGVNLHKACQSENNAYARKYTSDDQKEGVAVGGTPVANFVLGAFLPVTAIVGFVGGRFYAGRRVVTEQTREIMSDYE